MSGMARRVWSRREMLGVGAKLALGAIAAGTAACAKAPANACVDPEQLTDSERSIRKSLGYVEQFSNKEQVCARCSFFTASAGSCGTCSILNGTVNATGHCSSWAAAS